MVHSHLCCLGDLKANVVYPHQHCCSKRLKIEWGGGGGGGRGRMLVSLCSHNVPVYAVLVIPGYNVMIHCI